MARCWKYYPLTKFLLAASDRGERDMICLFTKLDELILGGLPPSARKYPVWWANSGQPHSRAWREAGWRVARVDQVAGMWVRFRKEEAATTAPQAIQARVACVEPADSQPMPLMLVEPILIEPDEPEPERRLMGFHYAPQPALAPAVPFAAAPATVAMRLIDRTDVRVIIEWRAVGELTLDNAGELLFPALPDLSGLYRFMSRDVPDQPRPKVYVGETEMLSRRMAGYRTPWPTQTTNKRMNAALVARLRAGGRVLLDIATEAQVSVSGAAPVPLSFSRKSGRLLGESAEIVAAALAGIMDIENACEASDDEQSAA